VTPARIATAHWSRAAPDDGAFRPLITYSSPSRSIRVVMWWRRSSRRRLGHREARPDLAGEQRNEPPLLLFGGPEVGQQPHVAGLGRVAVEHLGPDQAVAHLLEDGSELEVGQPRATPLRLRQEQVPQAASRALALSSSITAGWWWGSPESSICRA
jgi:hypothetical protein